MPRGRKKENGTLEEQLTSVKFALEKAEENVKALKQKEKELETAIKQENLPRLRNFLQQRKCLSRILKSSSAKSDCNKISIVLY